MAKEFITGYKGKTPYSDFAEYLNECGIYKTNDNISFTSSKLSKRELNSMMRELI
jgi:hypothetical protein